MTREIVTIPVGLKYGSFRMDPQRFDMDEVSDTTGEVDTLVYGHPRWKIAFSAPDDMPLSESALWEVLTMRLKGKLNRLAVYDPVRLLPQGTMRGSVTLNANALKGAEQIQINAGAGQASTTLEAGDLLQVGDGYGTSQLVKVMANVVLNGSGIATVEINHYLRQAYSSGTIVSYDKPVAYFGAIQQPGGWSYRTNSPLVAGFAVDMLEQWT
jgi:hypothetical protein